MDVTVNSDLCVGCGLCEENLPRVFIMKNQKAEVIKSGMAETDDAELKDMIEDCPAEAISAVGNPSED